MLLGGTKVRQTEDCDVGMGWLWVRGDGASDGLLAEVRVLGASRREDNVSFLSTSLRVPM